MSYPAPRPAGPDQQIFLTKMPKIITPIVHEIRFQRPYIFYHGPANLLEAVYATKCFKINRDTNYNSI